MSERLARRILLGLGIALLSIWVLREAWGVLAQFGPVLALFFTAWLISFVLSPLTNTLVKIGVRRPLAVMAVYLFVLTCSVLALLLLTPLVADQLGRLLEIVNAYTAQTPGMLTWAEEQARAWGVSEEELRSFYRSGVDQARALIGSVLQNAIGLLTGAAALLVNIVFCLIISIYMMLDGRRIAAGALGLAPRRYRGAMMAVFQSISENFGGFIRGQLLLAVIYGLAVLLVMTVAGLDYKALCSIFAGAAMIIPFVGPFISMVPPIVVALLLKPSETWSIILLLLIAQQVVLNVIAPRVFGKATNMHPLLVIAAALTGATLAGVWGALFGIPVAGILASVAKRLYTVRQTSDAEEAVAAQAAAVSQEPSPAAGRPLPTSGPAAAQAIDSHPRRD